MQQTAFRGFQTLHASCGTMSVQSQSDDDDDDGDSQDTLDQILNNPLALAAIGGGFFLFVLLLVV